MGSLQMDEDDEISNLVDVHIYMLYGGWKWQDLLRLALVDHHGIPVSANGSGRPLQAERTDITVHQIQAAPFSKRNQPLNEDHVSGSGADEYNNADVMMAMSVKEQLDWIMDSGGSYHIAHKRDYLFNFEKYDGGNVLLGDGSECRVRGTCKVQVQMRDGSSFVSDIVKYVLELRQNLISLDGMVFSCGCKAEIWVTKGLLNEVKGNILGVEIVKGRSGNTLRVSQSRFYNEKLVQTWLEGHSILLLEDGLSGDCDVEKNDRRISFVDFDYVMRRSITSAVPLYLYTLPGDDTTVNN
ncbi:hypothetical protein Tco_0528903 [Tanacetum coccineum]